MFNLRSNFEKLDAVIHTVNGLMEKVVHPGEAVSVVPFLRLNFKEKCPTAADFSDHFMFHLSLMHMAKYLLHWSSLVEFACISHNGVALCDLSLSKLCGMRNLRFLVGRAILSRTSPVIELGIK